MTLFCTLQIIYICRNPKDVIVSFFNFVQSEPTIRLHTTFEDFFERFMNGVGNSQSLSHIKFTMMIYQRGTL